MQLGLARDTILSGKLLYTVVFFILPALRKGWGKFVSPTPFQNLLLHETIFSIKLCFCLLLKNEMFLRIANSKILLQSKITPLPSPMRSAVDWKVEIRHEFTYRCG